MGEAIMIHVRDTSRREVIKGAAAAVGTMSMAGSALRTLG
jgi:hypothetical protein